VLRERLATCSLWDWPTVEHRYDSVDGTCRYLLKFADGKTVETVFGCRKVSAPHLYIEPGRLAVDCKFCFDGFLLGRSGISRPAKSWVKYCCRRTASRVYQDKARLNIVMMAKASRC